VSSGFATRWLHGVAAGLALATTLGVAAQTADADLGKRIYREGVLSSGQPLRATVSGDVSLTGAAVACVNCHRRAGMGAIEAGLVVTAVSGGELFRARTSGYAPRPAYTDESLARMLREGIDAAGRHTDPLMPLYDLPDEELRLLVAYLSSLSAGSSPGVSDEEIRFATVVAGEVEPGASGAMLDVLRAFFDEKNRLTRNDERRRESGPFFRDYRDKAFRVWALDVWEITGPPESWPDQLGRRYQERPVFALVSGIAAGPWEPIHRFAEENELPSLLPNTDLPALEENGYYTLYFSQGVALEAGALARHLSEGGADRILQVYRPESPGHEAALPQSGDVAVADWSPTPSSPLSVDQLADEIQAAGATSIVLWLGREDLQGLRAWEPDARQTVYVSATLIDESFDELPEGLRVRAFAVDPFTPPDERERRMARVRGWLANRHIESPHTRIQAQTYFACMMAGGTLTRLRRNFYRDYFMDSLEHADRMAAYAVSFPRLSFGPGQRYLAKGAHIVPLGGDSGWERATWVIP